MKTNKKGIVGWNFIIGLIIVLTLVIIGATISTNVRDVILDSLKWFITC